MVYINIRLCLFVLNFSSNLMQQKMAYFSTTQPDWKNLLRLSEKLTSGGMMGALLKALLKLLEKKIRTHNLKLCVLLVQQTFGFN